MKWYTCCNERGLRLAGECLLPAIKSCLQNTRLQPHLVFDGPRTELTEYIESLGVTVIYHSLSFCEAIEKLPSRPGFDKDWAIGTFLRFDLPLIENNDTVVLYTDIDVVFLQDPTIGLLAAPLAAANEYILEGATPLEASEVFNAGVMFLNLAVFRELHGEIVRLILSGELGDDGGWYDQGILNLLFRDYRAHLPQSFNWRPFAGQVEAPKIVHFQLLKPNDVKVIRGASVARTGITDAQRDLHDKAFDAYTSAMTEFERYAGDAGSGP